MNKYVVAFNLLIAGVLIVLFQNCSRGGLEFINREYESLQNQTVFYYTVEEDQVLKEKIKTSAETSGQTSQLSLLKKAEHGQMTFNVETAEFEYQPDSNYFGLDQFTFSELMKDETTPVIKTVSIKVNSINDLPYIVTDSVNFKMTEPNQSFQVQAGDTENSNLEILLDSNKSSSVKTNHGEINKTETGFTYTPDEFYRGRDEYEFIVQDQDGESSKKKIGLVVGNSLKEFQPAIAVRAMGCITCHASIKSKVITDFGYGSSYFLGQGSSIKFEDNIYGNHGNSSRETSWHTATFSSQILVPKSATIPSALQEKLNNSKTLAEYIESIENTKSKPASVVKKDKIFIGAPSKGILEKRFKATNTKEIKFIKNNDSDPDFSGLVQTKSNSQAWQAVSKTLVCEGDLFIPGTVRLKDVTIKTQTGCRIYSTGPVFIDGKIDYTQVTSGLESNLTNLQITSARAIIMGVGSTHCESNGKGWYASHTDYSSPLDARLHNFWNIEASVTRGTTERKITPQKEGAEIMTEAEKFDSITDASCYAKKNPRELHFERLLLNAPNIQSRYTGQFSGVIIGEIALFSLSKFDFIFDPVFEKVNVLPFLKESDFLEVQ